MIGLFKPIIIAFCCHWWSYAGADLAGSARLKYAANVLPIRVMCSGRISPHFILKAFQEGADGVLIAGCHIGSCHYGKGNYITAKRVAVMKDLLGFVGLSPKRLRLEWIATSESNKFANVVSDFTREINELGPSPLREASSKKKPERVMEPLALQP